MISLYVIGMYKINRSYYKSNNGRTIKLQQVTLLQHYALSGIQKSYLIADDRNKTTEYSILVMINATVYVGSAVRAVKKECRSLLNHVS